MIEEHCKDCVRQSQKTTGQNQSTEGQRALVASYLEATRDLELPETPHNALKAWVQTGLRASKHLSYLKANALWNRL